MGSYWSKKPCKNLKRALLWKTYTVKLILITTVTFEEVNNERHTENLFLFIFASKIGSFLLRLAFRIFRGFEPSPFLWLFLPLFICTCATWQFFIISALLNSLTQFLLASSAFFFFLLGAFSPKDKLWKI